MTMLPLKATRGPDTMPLQTQNVLGTPGHQQPNFCGYIHYAAPPYSAHISAIYLFPFGKVWFGSVYRMQPPGNEAERKITENR